MADSVNGDLILPNDLAKIEEVDKRESAHPTKAVLSAASSGLTLDSFQPIPKNCDPKYHAQRISGKRPLDQIWWIVMHDTEGPTAASAAAWFANPDSQGSAHVVVDDNICYLTLNEDEIPWGAPGANYHGWHIEQAGFVTWTSLVWSQTHRKTLKRAAYRAAIRCKKFNIPVRFCKAADLQASRKGITTHAECTKAFGGTHTDPGVNYPMYLFLLLVSYYQKQIYGE